MTNLEITPGWHKFVQLAKYVRSNPRFDIEERYVKLEVARAVNLALERARIGTNWLQFLDAVLLRHGHRSYLPYVHQCEWLKAWASGNEESVRQGLAGFLDPKLDAEERFAQFVKAARRSAGESVKVESGSILAFGSLFNFSQAPHSLPLMRADAFGRLESLLGYAPSPGSRTDTYSHHLRFAHQVQELLGDEEVLVKDMLDVQGLIFAAARERHDGWPFEADDGQQDEHQALRDHFVYREKRTQPPEPAVYLSVLSMYRDHGSYLREWIEFHRLVGVQHFFLYNNGSADDHLDVLAPYLADGTVTLHEMEFFPPQFRSYRHCLKEHRYESRWIAFIDIDEFLFCPAGMPVPEVLAEYEDAPAVGVNSVVYGTSGHRSRPDGLVIENYLAALYKDKGIKSIADPRRAVDCLTPHHFLHTEGVAVDENHHPIIGPGTTYTSMARLRINHYHTKSEEELRAKYAVLRPDTGMPRPEGEPDRMLSEQAARYGWPDDAILRYVPALRKALGLTSPQSLVEVRR